MVHEDLIACYMANRDSNTSSERLPRRLADRPSPAARRTTPRARTPYEAPYKEERTAYG